jgi:dTDP-4-dehydrorhamnose 3,5-epimerase
MDLLLTKIPGCYELKLTRQEDLRGTFVKTFHRNLFQSYNLEIDYCEDYYSISHQRVLRGLHFQIPPYDHVKLVYCVYGEVIDVVVDLRQGSPTFGDFHLVNLSAEQANMVYIPKGLAHGFYVGSSLAIVMYKVTTVYTPDYDGGILWNSVSIPWSDDKPILSNRDKNFIPFSKFESPFSFT